MEAWGVVLVAMVAVAAQGQPAPLRVADAHRLSCLTEPEARAALQTPMPTPPARAVAEALRDGDGEAVAIHLCHSGETGLIYDIAVLRRDGRLVHVVVDTKTGAVQPGRKQP